MSRAVYVGGFGNGRLCAERVGEALGSHFEDVDPFTFSDLVSKPEVLRRALEGATLVTHSAGALALSEAAQLPKSATLLNPPVRRSVVGLFARTLVKTARMHMAGAGIQAPGDALSVAQFSASSLAELAAHPVANFGMLDEIANFSAVREGVKAHIAGTPTEIFWTHDDAYFKPSDRELQMAEFHGLPVTMLEGEHDEVVLRPQATLSQVFK